MSPLQGKWIAKLQHFAIICNNLERFSFFLVFLADISHKVQNNVL